MSSPTLPVRTGWHLYHCEGCGLVTEAPPAAPGLRCARCDMPLHLRKPQSLERCAAFLVAAMLLYIPANVLPVMRTTTVLGEEPHTILGGIAELWTSGSWELAVIVFIASIAVPLLKIGALLLLLYTAQRRSSWRQLERSRLYRLVETVGHWSMLDIFVVVLLVGMVRFGAFASVQPDAGLLAFGAVVVLTMMSAACFDPRLIWPQVSEPSAPPGDRR